jgi:xylitol oxidase
MVEAIGDTGDEMQTEYMIGRGNAVEAIRALKDQISEMVRPYIFAAEVRSVAADDLWLSTAYQRDTVCLHYATRADLDMPNQVIPAIERTLAPFEPRPHWGKLFAATAEELAPRYPRMGDFRALADRLDPRRAFRSEFLTEKVFGA